MMARSALSARVPWYARTIQKIRLVRYDLEKGVPSRGADGLCMETANGEIGEAIGKIDPNDPRSRFDGYTSTQETEKKILRDAFAKGDAWFRTGDLMRRDAHGYFYFVDRTGDTFRWKGENVATSEVAEALSSFPASRKPMSMASKCPAATARREWPRSSPMRASI
jgi:fatty-acyl-CoA synthase